MRVAITGATGLIGSALSQRLSADGHQVVPVSRRPGPGTVQWDPVQGILDLAGLDGVTALVHLAGESIDGRWTAAKRRRLLDSRVASTELLARTIARLDEPPSVWLSGSAIHYYGDRGTERLGESSPPGSGFMADVCVAWERATMGVSGDRVRVAHLRTGLVLSADGGALRRMLLPFRLGVGGKLGGGRQIWSWISIADEVGAIVRLLDADVEGPVNLTAPESVSNAAFTKALGRALRRPTVMPIPSIALKALFGRMADELLLASTDVRPDVLSALGYSYQHPTLEVALTAELDG